MGVTENPMAVRIVRSEPAVNDRIRRRIRPAKHAPPNPQALAAVREVVRRSKSVEDAIAAVAAINSAWSSASPATHAAIALMLVVFDLSDNVRDAEATVAMLRSDGSFLKPLTAIQRFVGSEFPDARIRIIPGDDVASSYLYVMIPTEDCPSFWDAHVRLRDWSIETFPGLSEVIQIAPRPVSANV